jgi:hypothetical protein
MNLLEILNTNPDVTWTTKENSNIGQFQIDDIKYEVYFDEYTAIGKNLIDFGFSRNKSYIAVNSKTPASKIIGAVYNIFKNNILKYDPDIVLVSVQKDSGLVDSRKSMYSTLSKWVQRMFGFNFDSDWVENKKGYYRIWSKDNLSEEEIKIFVDQVKSK